MQKNEPPLSPSHSLFFIGRNSRGNWVVQDQAGARGGLFVDRGEALRFAMFENGNHPQAVVMVPGIFDLDLARRSTPEAANDRARRAA